MVNKNIHVRNMTKHDNRPHNGETKAREIYECVGSIDIETSEYIRQQYKNMVKTNTK